MDFCDVSVRVLYDFEYTTKYGRNIKITTGERLLLIKKTNNDWWQVIRSTEQRPFYVPASYVEEIDTTHVTANKYQSRTQAEKQALSLNYPIEKSFKNNTDTATKSQKDSDNTSNLGLSLSEKDVIVSNLKKELISPPKNKVVTSTMSSSGYNSLCEEIPVFDEEDAPFSIIVDNGSNSQYKSNDSLMNVYKSHSVSKSNIDNKQSDVIVDPPASDKELSGTRDNSFNTSGGGMLEGKLIKCNENSKYCTVTNPRECVSEVSNYGINSSLPASDSLENLALQIELKTSSLRSATDINSKYIGLSMNKKNTNLSEDIVTKNKSFLTDNCNILSKEETEKVTKEKWQPNLFPSKCKESRSSENVCGNSRTFVDNNNLQYHGSFKTNTERQRWFKKSSSEKQLRNVFSCSEESSTDLTADSGSVGEVSNVSVGVTAKKSSEDVSINEECCSVVNIKEVQTARKIDEVLQQSEYKEQFYNRHFYFGSDGQLSHLKSAREKTVSRHSLDSVIEGELKENCDVDFEDKKHKNKEVFPVVTNVLGMHQANSEKSSTDSLLDLENDVNYRKISGGTTSDSLVPTDGEDLISSDSETDSVKYIRSKQEDFKNISSNSRKIPLTRRRRVFASKSRVDIIQEPPSPTPSQEPSRTLCEGWNEYDTDDGRKYFYNTQTKDKRWKPPRRSYNTNMEIQEENDPNSTADTDDMFVVSLPLPSGWRSEIDSVSGQTCYINIASGAKWFSSTDSEGRVYFFEENSNKSSWTLPDNLNVNNNESKTTDVAESNSLPTPPVAEKSLNRNVKSKSMILAARHEETSSFSNPPHHWPQLWEGTMCVLKEGPLNKTKITENGKRVRKNWTSTHAVLTELLLLFFKDNKGFPSMMSGNGRPELSVDLNGAVIDTGDKISSRKNVYMLSTVLGLQVLIQCDCATVAEQWLQAIQTAINNLPSSVDTKSPRPKTESLSEEDKTTTRIGRSKSMKLKNKTASIEDMSVNISERQVKIRERLKKFFHKRPSVEMLVKKGIWKDEPVFGCLLEHVCPPESPRVPLFVQHCIHCIERSEENMKTDGLYRASGNLSQVQKIRLQVDQNLYSLLEQEEDVHVLAGTLKLFFRELKQPLIPFKFFNKALNASTKTNHTEKIKDFRDIVKSLPSCNHDTLNLLLQHLLNVTKYHEFNRMHIPNIAIVFGPTLMWPEQESLNMAFDLMQQNLVIECFLSDFHAIFQ